MLAEVRQQESILLDLIESGTSIVGLLLQQPEVRTVFVEYHARTTPPEALDKLLQPVLDSWLLRSSTISGAVIRAADGRILGKAGTNLTTVSDLNTISLPAPAAEMILHAIAGTGQIALTVPVKVGNQAAAGAVTLLLSESGFSPRTWQYQSHWSSAHYSPVTRSSSRGVRFVRLTSARDGAVERELHAIDPQTPGVVYLDEVLVAWSGIGVQSAGVLGQVDADEFSRTAAATAQLETSGAAVVFLLAGMLVMFRSRQLTRRLGQDLTQLRGELASQIREEQGLLASTAQMSTAARLAAIGHWVTQRTDSGWVWTAATPEIARIYGVPRRRLIGGLGFSRQLVHPEHQARMRAIWDEVNRNPRRYEAEFRLVRPSGEVRHVVEVGEAMFDQYGALINFHGTMQDITDYGHSESVVSEAEARLHQPPKERNCVSLGFLRKPG